MNQSRTNETRLSRSRIRQAIGAIILAATAAASWPAFAHHSFAVYDRTKTLTLKGTVKTFQWTNPHCWLDVIVVDKVETKWALEGPSPAMLQRKGWDKNRVKPGDKIKVSLFPTRDGANSGSIRNITLGDGTVLWANATPDDK